MSERNSILTVQQKREPKSSQFLQTENIHRPPQIELFSDPSSIPTGFTHGLELVNSIPWFEPDKKTLTIRGAATPSDLILTRLCTIAGQKIELTVKAATLNDCYRFPGGREELVFDALLKIASEGHNGVFIEDSSAVAFSLSKVHRTLKLHNGGKAKFNLNEIKEALIVLNTSAFDIRLFDPEGGSESYSDNLISGLGVLSRDDWLTSSDKDVTCYARFHPMVTQAIKKMRVRPYSLTHNVQFTSPAARRLHKHLSMVYKQASIAHPYTISLQTALSLVGYRNKNEAKVYSAARPIEKGLDELVAKRIIHSWDSESAYSSGLRGRQVEADRLYTLYPHEEYCKATKQSNAIQSTMSAKMRLIQSFASEEIKPIESFDDFDAVNKLSDITRRVKSMSGDQAKKVLQKRLDGGDDEELITE